MSSDITRSESIKTLKEHLSHWERLLQEHICEEQEGIDTISALKLAIASLETDEAYQLEYERTTKNDLGVDCISRADAKAKKIYSHERHEYVVPVAEIDWLPLVTSQPRKGHWIVQPSNEEQGERPFIWWKCSECGQVIFSETEHDRLEFHAFCGRCGSDNREVVEE